MKFHELNDIHMGTTTYIDIINGVSTLFISNELLVGDLVKINYGEILPADIIMVGGNEIRINYSSLRRESKAVSKKPFEKSKKELENKNKNISSNILLIGTNMIEGAGKTITVFQELERPSKYSDLPLLEKSISGIIATIIKIAYFIIYYTCIKNLKIL